MEESTTTYLLTLETATEVCSVALYDRETLLGFHEYKGAKMHSRLLVDSIDTLLTKLEIDRKLLSAVAISGGPGSYTGLRVGVSAAKGVCMALDIPLIAISSLQALAAGYQALAQQLNAQIIPMLDARRMEVWTAIYDADLNEVEAPHARILDKNPFKLSKPTIFIGDGVHKATAILKSEHSILLPNRLSSAANFGALAYQKYLEKAFEPLIAYEPFYLKPVQASIAKNKLKLQHKK